MVTVESAACLGIQAYKVQIEVDVSNGLPQFNVVGLPDTSVKESRERVRAAIKNSGYPFPPDRITINLAPADIKKEGAAFDLPMALGILAEAELFPIKRLEEFIFLGELALDGSLRPFKGAIAVASELKEEAAFVFPSGNAAEAALDKNAIVYAASHLKDVVEFLRDEKSLAPISQPNSTVNSASSESVDFSEVRGQALPKRAIEIAVAGGHNLLLIGPPGSGKSMLARRIPTILPPLNFEESLELTKIFSITGLSQNTPLASVRPFRAPHHSISAVALAGGGAWPKPGEISLAHHGVLFLDELPEFRRDVLETLRSPLEEGEVRISRAKHQVVYPARFLLVGAMNPCPCGYLNDSRRNCRCSLGQIQKYQTKLSGPLIDRLDLHVEVPALNLEVLSGEENAESSVQIRSRIVRCRELQRDRYADCSFSLNSQMRGHEVRIYANPDKEGRKLLELALKELHLSARAYYKVLKIARTIADLGNSEPIRAIHLAEAIQYRSLDRQWSR